MSLIIKKEHESSQYYFIHSMLIHFGRSEYNLQYKEGMSYEDIVCQASKLMGKSSEPIILYDINNKPLIPGKVSDFTDNTELIAYEEGRVIEDGFNKCGLCTNKDCSFYNQDIIESCGFVSCERVFYGCIGKCPYCTKSFEVSKIFLKNCHFSYTLLSKGKQPVRSDEFDADSILPEDYDISYFGDVEYDFSVQSTDCYICKQCHKKIDGNHSCERVHRHSLCDNCSGKSFVC